MSTALATAGLELGTILRPALPFRSGHVVADLELAYACGYANRLWDRREAMRVLFAANMEIGNSYGHGSRAGRRLIALRAERLGLSVPDYLTYVKDMAELAREEAQRETRAWYEASQRREVQEAEHEAPV